MALTIIGCGNRTQSDDGVGVHVVELLGAWLREHPHESVRVVNAGTAGMEVMFQACSSTAVVIVDASACGADPGAIVEAPASTLQGTPHRGFSLHDLRWDHALRLGRRLFKEDFPRDVTVFLIEAAELGPGTRLTDSVTRAADQVVDRLIARIERDFPSG